MASRMKEDERNEKIIRGLLKLPANKRCINCNNLGPQYVCTNFWTFICTNCSGLHREFCHRVKSISMAKFTTQEVNALQEGGNEKAKKIYLKEWDPQRHSLPDSNNIDRLRDFIRHVYVDRRFTGERNTDRAPQGKADWNDSNDGRRGDSYRGDSRSPLYEDRYSKQFGAAGRNDDQNSRYVYGERSPGFDRGDNKRSPHRVEVANDRVNDDKYGFRRFEDRKLPDIAAKPEGSSPSRQNVVLSPPAVRPVRDILGDDVPQLRVGDATKPNSAGFPDSSAPTQRTSSTSSIGSTDGNSAQLKRVNSGSLIDFTADPQPPVTATTEQPAQQNIFLPSNGGDWASFDNVGQEKVSPAAVNAGSMESTLSQLSTLGPANTSLVASLPTSGIGASVKTNDIGQWSQVQQHQTSLFPANLGQHMNPPSSSSDPTRQAWVSSAVSSTQVPLPNSGGQLPQVANIPPQETSIGISTQPTSMEAKPIGRKELPADLFAALYLSAPGPLAGWQRGPHPGIGYGMQYSMGMSLPQQAMPVFPHPSKSSNPFDAGSEPVLTHSPTFPSMTSLQGALPQVPGLSPRLRSSSFGNLPPQWVPPQQSSFPSAASQGPYMVQQIPGSMLQMPNNTMVMMGHQGIGGPVNPAASFGNLGMHQLPPGRYPQPNAPNSFGSTGGNPFG